jgi:hypothetical protein
MPWRTHRFTGSGILQPEIKPDLARRFVVITGDTLSGTVRAFLDETRRPCIEKPFVPIEVIRLVAAVAAGADRESPPAANSLGHST